MAKKESFESVLNELKECSDKIKSSNLSLDEAIKCYEKGTECYDKALKILEETKQKIKYYTPEDDE